MNRILTVDKEKRWVKVEAGVKIHELARELAKVGLALPNQGYIDFQTVAGAIGTATHGSGKTGTLSSFVREIELIDGLGNEHRLTQRE